MSENKEKKTVLSMVRVGTALATVELGVALLSFLASTFFAKETGFEFEMITCVTFTISMVVGFSGFLLMAQVILFSEKNDKLVKQEDYLVPVKAVKFSMPNTALCIGSFQMIIGFFALILLLSKPIYEGTMMEHDILLTTTWASFFSGCITMLLGSVFIGEENKEK